MKSCKDCIFIELASNICDYPVPAWITMRTSGGHYLTGIEAEACPLYKTKVDLIESVKKGE